MASLTETLKTVLGDAYTEQADVAIKAFIGENFVAKADFRAKTKALSDLQEKLDKIGDPTEQIDNLKKAHADELKELNDKFNSSRLARALKEVGARDTDLVKAKIDLSKLDFTTDEISGLDEQIASVKKSYEYLFNDSTPTGTGVSAISGGAGATNNTSTDRLRKAFGLPPETQN